MLFTNRIILRSLFGKRNHFPDHPNVVRNLGKVLKNRYEVPAHIKKPHYYSKLNKPSSLMGEIEIKNEEQINGMRQSCKLAANILKMCDDIVKVKK